MFEANIMWLIGAYILGTFMGWWFSYNANAENIVGATIDGLIENGYIKTRGEGENMELIPWKDWEEDKNAN